FASHGKLFDDIQIQLLKTAETSGSLDYTLDRMATDLETKSNLVSKFRGAMIYPILVIVVAIFVIFLVLTQMIPPMKALYQSFNAKLPAPTQFVITLSTFVIGYWPIILIVLVVVVFGFIFYRRSAQGKKTTDAIFLKIPLFGGLISKIQVVNFGKTFILLIKAGVPLVVGLNLIADSMSNEVFKSGIREIAIDVEKGRPMSTAMSKYSFFPPLLWRMVAIGEETGKMEEVLTKVIEYYESETKDLIENMSKLLEPMITIFLGVIVGFIGVAVYLPIYNLGNVIK
ncbi:type II secretion system F family protein, partial [Patescibacteria group bacterium]|nr:type II secretion system F family protein [Patescibacteria group bacterium]